MEEGKLTKVGEILLLTEGNTPSATAASLCTGYNTTCPLEQANCKGLRDPAARASADALQHPNLSRKHPGHVGPALGVTSARTSPALQTSLRRRISRPPGMRCSGREDGQLTHQSRHRRAGPARPPCPAGAQPVGRGMEAAGGVRRGPRHADGLPSTPARCGRHTSALESPGKGCTSGEMGDIVLVTWWSRKTFKEKYQN